MTTNLQSGQIYIDSMESMRAMAGAGVINVDELWDIHGVMLSQAISSDQKGNQREAAMAYSLEEQATALAVSTKDENGRARSLRFYFSESAQGGGRNVSSHELAKAGLYDQRVWHLGIRAAGLGVKGLSPIQAHIATAGPRVLWAEARNTTPDPSSVIVERSVYEDGTRVERIVGHRALVNVKDIATPGAARDKLFELVVNRPTTFA